MRRVLKFMAATMAIAVAIGGSGDEAGVTGAVEGAEPVPANSAADARVRGEFPRVVELEGGMVVIHAPQVRSWEDFELIEGLAVVETIPKDARAPRFGILGFSANAVPDLEARTVHLDHIAITSLQEKGEELPVETRELVASALDLGARDIPLDLVLSHLADGVIPANTDSIKMEPPRIIVSTTPAVVVLLQGDPVLAPVADGGLLFAANTNWPLFKVEASGEWYLRNNEQWLVAADLDGPWIWAKDLPAALKNLPDEANWRSTRKAALEWSGVPEMDPPTVFVDTMPAELILLDGEPQLVAVGADGLSFAANTDSALFRYEKRWYYLVSGRWFTNKTLDGAWIAVLELPEAFASIPEDHEKADVLTAVPGTPAARMAALDAQIPKKTQVPVDVSMPETVTYAGEPTFAPIQDTDLYRATNTSYSVIQAGTQFYLCYSGMWYVSNAPAGPWRVASTIPAAIYQIPPSSPVYHTTYVKVYDSSPTTVTFGYTMGYSSVYISNGVPVYGTGWYYPPYYYYYGGYPVYYGYPYTYGSGSYYNRRTGAYGSVSRAYGPYGGYGYASAYNPRTGTYGRAEAVWDHDEWYGVGEAYNPRTGRYFGTERYYDDDHNEWEIDSTFAGRRGQVDVSREFDDDSGRATIETSRGGEGTITRRESGDGWNTQSEFETAGGRSVVGSGRYEDGEGASTIRGSEGGVGTIERSVDDGVATREGSFTRDGKTLSTETTRDGSGPRTTFETSEGASGAVVGRGLNRTAVAESASGDLYAARDGNVYKKSDNGWSRHAENTWKTIDMPDRSSRSATNRSTYGGGGDRYGNLDRDYSARHRGMSRSRSYNRGYSGGGGRASGGRRRR